MKTSLWRNFQSVKTTFARLIVYFRKQMVSFDLNKSTEKSHCKYTVNVLQRELKMVISRSAPKLLFGLRSHLCKNQKPKGYILSPDLDLYPHLHEHLHAIDVIYRLRFQLISEMKWVHPMNWNEIRCSFGLKTTFIDDL